MTIIQVLLFKTVTILGSRILPTKTYLKILYRIQIGKKLNLDNPKTFNEKIQWTKIHDNREIYTEITDKFRVKKHVEKIIGSEYIPKLYAAWDNPNKISIENLPNKFVIKTNNDSGGIIICKDKSKIDIKNAHKTMKKAFKKKFYYTLREWQYKILNQ